MKKKLLGLLVASVMALSLTACGGSKAPDASEKPKQENADVEAGTDGKKEDVDFYTAMISDTGGVNDQSFNQSAWEGLQAFETETGAKIGFIESVQESDYASNFDKLVDEEANLIWGIGFALADHLSAAAEMNPERLFGIIDFDFGKDTPSNVASTEFDVQDSSFLVGYAAALTTKTNRVGYIGGMKSPTMDYFEYGYKAGVEYGAAELGKEITVDIQFAESFTDAAKGKAMAAAMYSAGSDIIFHAAGGAGVDVIEQAVEANKWVIGVDRDQSYLASENMLTSALKTVGVATEAISKAVINGEDIGGKTFNYGLKDGAVGIPAENPNMDPEVEAKVRVIETKITAGEIVAPNTEESYNNFQNGL